MGSVLPSGRAEARVERIENVAYVARQWEALEPWCEVSIFQSSVWVVPWLQEALAHFDVYLVKAEHAGMVIGLGLCVPRRIRRRFVPFTALFINESGPSGVDFCIEHNGFLLRRGYEREAMAAILRSLHRTLTWDELHLRRCSGVVIPMEEMSTLRLRLRIPDTTVAPFVDLEKVRAAGGDCLVCLSANRRSQLRRSLRLLQDRGTVDVHAAQNVDQALRYFDDLKTLHQSHWKKKGEPGAFSNPRWEVFHRELIKAGVPNGSAQLLRISAGECVIGYIYSLVRNGYVSMIQSGINYELDGKIHPGEVCHMLAINWNARKGNLVYDFLGGDMRYKRSLATGVVNMDYIVIQKRRVRFLLEDMLRTLRDAFRPTWTRAWDKSRESHAAD